MVYRHGRLKVIVAGESSFLMSPKTRETLHSCSCMTGSDLTTLSGRVIKGEGSEVRGSIPISMMVVVRHCWGKNYHRSFLAFLPTTQSRRLESIR